MVGGTGHVSAHSRYLTTAACDIAATRRRVRQKIAPVTGHSHGLTSPMESDIVAIVVAAAEAGLAQNT